MDLSFFENNKICQNFNKIVWKIIKFKKKIVSKTFQEYSKNIIGIFPKKKSRK